MLRQIVRVSKFWREYAGQLAVEAIDESLLTNSGVSIVLLSMVTHYLISIEVFEVSTSEPGVP